MPWNPWAHVCLSVRDFQNRGCPARETPSACLGHISPTMPLSPEFIIPLECKTLIYEKDTVFRNAKFHSSQALSFLHLAQARVSSVTSPEGCSLREVFSDSSRFPHAICSGWHRDVVMQCSIYRATAPWHWDHPKHGGDGGWGWWWYQWSFSPHMEISFVTWSLVVHRCKWGVTFFHLGTDLQ